MINKIYFSNTTHISDHKSIFLTDFILLFIVFFEHHTKTRSMQNDKPPKALTIGIENKNAEEKKAF